MNDYGLLIEQAKAFAEDSTWDITLYANISALLFESLEDLNWAGFYLMRDGEPLGDLPFEYEYTEYDENTQDEFIEKFQANVMK